MKELVKVVLSRDWNKHKEGSTLSVDSVRAAWLQSAGYLESKKAKSRERVSKPKTD